MGASESSEASSHAWQLEPPISARTVLWVFAAVLLLAVSANRTDMGRLITLSADAVAASIGLKAESQVSDGFGRILSGMLPLQFAETREVSRIEGFDRNDLPWGAHLQVKTVETKTLDPATLELRSTSTQQEVLIEPYGYLVHVFELMLETIEIAAWGTLLALLLAVPLAWFGARNYSPHIVVYLAARGFNSFLRAVPELISALLLVLVFGFGPIAGVLALSLHTAGFLGKFFAEDIENAARAPQDALRAAGASTAKILRYAVLPQVLPSYLGYTQYILERNIRTATVIGIVGAGGIGQELKGRFEMFDFGHVATMLLVIFLTVITLEYLTGKMRAKLL